MKIGYPCINNRIGCTANSTFRLASYSSDKLIEKIQQNLQCLHKILEFNVKHGLLFFRIGSSLIPFASHPICTLNWQKIFSRELKKIGQYIRDNSIRISMHPDQFILINALNKGVVMRSLAELHYHCDLLDAMQLDGTAKVQIHVGGVYKDKVASMSRFIERYDSLPQNIKKRLVVENDERLFSVSDCLEIHKETKIPIVFDVLHHECFHAQESVREALTACMATWRKKDGTPMIDYSSQEKGARKGNHSSHLNIRHFKKFLMETIGLDFDMMLEIKDKEKSALRGLKLLLLR